MLGLVGRPGARSVGALARRQARWLASSSHSAEVELQAPPRIAGAEARDGRLVVRWEDGETHSFHACWLRDNCGCPRCRTSSGQRKHRVVVPGSPGLDVELADVSAGGEALQVKWCDHGSEPGLSVYDSQWLRTFAYSADTIHAEQRELSVARDSGKVPEVSFARLVGGPEGEWEWMSALNSAGSCLIRDCPTEEGTVKRVAGLMGPCSHGIYGETFDVKATPSPINIAYSDLELEPHMDLAYFESPPGVQLLHCVRFDEGVEGGDSTLIDAHAVAEEFQRREPELFEVLTKVPATFQKDHEARANPIKMFYQRPHIQVNYLGHVTAVFWSPPFEGPLRVHPDLVEPYYTAYHAFRKLLLSDEMWDRYAAVFRMEPGDMLVFNNRRMLHGRHAFTSAKGTRHLQGCYLDIDTYLNKYRVLAGRFHPRASEACLDGPGEQRAGTSSHR